MRASAHRSAWPIDRHLEHEVSPLYLDQLAADSDLLADHRRAFVAHAHMRPDGVVARRQEP